jgi:hypothetical protein
MKWKVFIVVVVIGLIAIIAESQSIDAVEQAKSKLAIEEAKARIEIYRVVEEEVRLKVSIIEHQVRLAKLQAQFTPKPDPNTVDPNNTE